MLITKLSIVSTKFRNQKIENTLKPLKKLNYNFMYFSFALII